MKRNTFYRYHGGRCSTGHALSACGSAVTPTTAPPAPAPTTAPPAQAARTYVLGATEIWATLLRRCPNSGAQLAAQGAGRDRSVPGSNDR